MGVAGAYGFDGPFIPGAKVDADLTDNRGYAVKPKEISDDELVWQLAGAGEQALLLANEPDGTAGGHAGANVRFMGAGPAVAGDTVTLGMEVTPNAVGRWVQAQAGDRVCGVALSGADNGEEFVMLVGAKGQSTSVGDHTYTTVAAISATTSEELPIFAPSRNFVIDKISIIPAADFVEDGTDYWTIKVKNGADEVAEWSTEDDSGAEGTLDGGELNEMTLDEDEALVDAEDVLTLELTKVESADDFPASTLFVIHGRYV